MSRRTRRAFGFSLALALGMALVYRRLFLGEILAGRDLFRLFIPDSTFLLECFHRGVLPLWNPYVRLGQPFAATLQSQAFYPPRWISILIAGPIAGVTLEQLLHVVIAACGTYLLCRKLRASHLAACVGAVGFALSPMFTDLAMQQNVASAVAWTGFLLLAAWCAGRAPSLRSAAWVAVFGALSFLAGSPETLLWQSALAVLVALGARRTARGPATVVAGLAWAFVCCAEVALPALELAARSVRAKTGIQPLVWSTSWAQLLAMLWPFADLPRGPYWGPDEWFIVNTFIGVSVGVLAFAALRKSGRVWPFALGGVALALLSAGSHFPPAAMLILHTPLHLFRYPAKYLVGAGFCAFVCAAMGLDRIAVWARRRRHLRGAVAVLGGSFAAIALGTPLVHPPLFRSGASSGLLWILLTLGVATAILLALPASSGRARRARWVIAAVVALELGAFQVLRVGVGWEPAGELTSKHTLAQAIPDPFHGRISVDLSAPGADLLPVKESLSALIPNSFVESRRPAFEGYGAPVPERFEALGSAPPRALYDLAGVGYYLRRGPPPFADLTPIASRAHGVTLSRSDTAFPRAFLVHQARVVTDAVALAKLSSPHPRVRRIAFLADGTPLAGPGCEGDATKSLQENASSVALDLHACGEGYVILGDSFAPGWRATVDGKAVPIHRVDYDFRAVRVTRGEHHLVMRYRPWSFRIGGLLAALAILGLLFSFWRGRKSAPGRLWV